MLEFYDTFKYFNERRKRNELISVNAKNHEIEIFYANPHNGCGSVNVLKINNVTVNAQLLFCYYQDYCYYYSFSS